jgi:hypothetical protein
MIAASTSAPALDHHRPGARPVSTKSFLMAVIIATGG